MTDPCPTRIVIVEDCATDAELLALVFDDAGASIEWCCVTSEQALREAFAAGRVDIVLSDYHLPGFDGMRALALVRELAPDVPFVFCCGELDTAFERTAAEAGAAACIAKREMWTAPETVARLLRRA